MGGSSSVGGAGNASGGTSPGSGGASTAFGGQPAGTGGTTLLNLDGGSPAGETLCDGLDNDNNGVVDDVDLQADGVCDCLPIATIGSTDSWLPKYPTNLFQDWLAQRSTTSAVALGSQKITPELIAPYRILVVLDVHSFDDNRVPNDSNFRPAFTPAETQALEAWVRAGGGLMTTLGYCYDDKEATNVNSLLQPFGLGYELSHFNPNAVTNFVPHPLTDQVTALRFWTGSPTVGTAGVALATAQNHEVLRAAEVDAGKVVIWGDDWILYDKEWQNVTTYQIERFWLNILKWLSPPQVCQVPIPVIL